MANQTVLDAKAKREAQMAAFNKQNPSSLQGTMTKGSPLTSDQLKTSDVSMMTNPLTGQPYSPTQQKNLQFQKDQLTGKITPQQAGQMKAQKLLQAAPDATGAAVTEVTKNQPYQRDMTKEAAKMKELGITNPTPEQQKLLFKATYAPSELEALGLKDFVNPPQSVPTGLPAGSVNTAGVPGGNMGVDMSKYGVQGSLSAQKMAELGLTPERLDQLVQSGQLSKDQLQMLTQTGAQLDQAALDKGAVPKPTNAMLGILEDALKAKSGIGKQAIGESEVFKAAGLNGFAVLEQSLSQRASEMDSNYKNYSSLVLDKSGRMLDAYNAVNERYKEVMDNYNQQMDRVLKVDERAKQYEQTLEIMKRQNALDIEKAERLADYQKKMEESKVQFVPETENQPGGYFDPATRTFTPLTVGGNAYTPYGSGSLLDSYSAASGGDTNSLYYSQPVAHGSANVEVISSNPKLINARKNGTVESAGSNGLGGQCAYMVEQVSNLPPVGNTIQQKAASFQKFVNQDFAFYKGQGQPKVGYAVFSNDDPNYGHYWLINAITKDGKLVASEWNRAGSRVYTNNRIVDPNDKSIIGFVKTTLNKEFQMGSDIDSAIKQSEGKLEKSFDQAASQNWLGKSFGAFAKTLVKNAVAPYEKAVRQTLTEQPIVEATKSFEQNNQAYKALQDQGVIDENGYKITAERQFVRGGNLSESESKAMLDKLDKSIKKGGDPRYKEIFLSDLQYARGENDAELQRIAQQVANYEVDPYKATTAKGSALSSSARSKVLDMAKQFNSSYNAADYEGKQDFRTKWQSGTTPGTYGWSNDVANTGIKHLAEAYKLFQKLNNQGIRSAIDVANWMKDNGNDPDLKAYKSVVLPLSGEILKASTGGAPGVTEIEEQRKAFESNLSTDAMLATIQAQLGLFSGKISTNVNKYKKNLGTLPKESVLDDDAVTALQQLGVDPSTVDPSYKGNNDSDPYASYRSTLPQGEILVMDKAGNIGGMMPNEFDPAQFTKL